MKNRWVFHRVDQNRMDCNGGGSLARKRPSPTCKGPPPLYVRDPRVRIVFNFKVDPCRRGVAPFEWLLSQCCRVLTHCGTILGQY